MNEPLGNWGRNRYLDRRDRRSDPGSWSAKDPGGMISSSHYLASMAGSRILAMGGNAIDAAIAASLVLGVVEPTESGLGGMAMALVLDARSGRIRGLEGGCRAPAGATPATLAGSNRYRGYRSIALPTYPAVIRELCACYASLPFDVLVAPAIELAEDGYPVTHLQSDLLRRYRRKLVAHGAGRFLLREGEHVPPPGHLLRQPILARTLRSLAEKGLDDFYRGGIAEAMLRDICHHGGFLRASDLELARQIPRDVEPMRGVFRERDIVTLGPPAGGASLLEMLNLLSITSGADFDPDRPEGAILLAEIIRRARKDRRSHSLNLDRDRPQGAFWLASAEFAHRSSSRIPQTRGLPPGGTSHLSVVDDRGNAISLTQSLDRNFGSAVATSGLGFLYNDYLNTFNLSNPHHPHFLRTGVPGRSNAAPALLFREGSLETVIGAAGSGRITSALLQVLARLDFQSPFEAVEAGRLHATAERGLLIERGRVPAEAVRVLQDRGYRITTRRDYSYGLAAVQMVTRATPGVWIGVADPRRDGLALNLQESGHSGPG